MKAFREVEPVHTFGITEVVIFGFSKARVILFVTCSAFVSCVLSMKLEL